MIKTFKARTTAGKGTISLHLPSTARSASKGTSMRQKQDPRKQGLVTQELFCRTVTGPELALNTGAPIGHTPWGRRRLAGRETGGGEKGARPFPCPLPVPSVGCRGRLVRGYYANYSDCGNKQGQRERRERLRIDCNFYKVSYNPKHKRQKQRESENQPARVGSLSKEERETVREAESAHCNCKSLLIWREREKKNL